MVSAMEKMIKLLTFKEWLYKTLGLTPSDLDKLPIDEIQEIHFDYTNYIEEWESERDY